MGHGFVADELRVDEHEGNPSLGQPSSNGVQCDRRHFVGDPGRSATSPHVLVQGHRHIAVRLIKVEPEAVQELDGLRVPLGADLEPTTVRRQREALAARCVRLHEVRLPPEVHLQLPGCLQGWVEMSHGHEEARGAAGEVEALAVERDLGRSEIAEPAFRQNTSTLSAHSVHSVTSSRKLRLVPSARSPSFMPRASMHVPQTPTTPPCFATALSIVSTL